MRFYTLDSTEFLPKQMMEYQNKYQASIYLLEIDSINILFLKGFNYNQILNYSPIFERNLQVHEETDQIKKKIKLNSENQQEEQERYQQQEKIKQQQHQIFCSKINDREFLKGNIKFDIKYLSHIFLTNVNYVLLNNIEDLQTIQIYCTPPIKQLGLYIVENFYNLISKRNKHINIEEVNQNYFMESEFLDYFEEKYQIPIGKWVELFQEQTYIDVFDKMIALSFGEQQIIKINDQQAKGIIIQPFSSGYNMGSCIWQLNFNNKEILVANSLSLNKNRHCQPIDMEHLNRSNIDYMYCLQEPVENEYSYNEQIQNLPVVQIADSLVEYVNPKLEDKIFMESQLSPFSSFQQMIKKNILQIFKDFSEFQLNNKSFSLNQQIYDITPSIFFVEDSTLRYGDTLKILELLENTNQKNKQSYSTSIILTDPQLQSSIVTDPITSQFKGVQVYHLPLDPQITKSEVKTFLDELNIKNLIVPSQSQNTISDFPFEFDVHYFSNDRDIQFKIVEQINKFINEQDLKNTFPSFKNTCHQLGFQFSEKVKLKINSDSKVVEIQKDYSNQSKNQQKLEQINQEKKEHNSLKEQVGDLTVFKNEQEQQEILIGLEQKECLQLEKKNQIKIYCQDQNIVENLNNYLSTQNIFTGFSN
ncbi:hypothetical protein PPERSA_10445 [Pseudocohnilembus persalinus]|uniref:Metallo-beta-lactamase domain-containing protein n=1 Tax=Pseudocohnilembus persalinus TaxID=266149 RepID=A0A0V0R0S4_PSEPJ|nr:hypothetical protein PPERSA_10445 [Pseudocohnilembus persalinus]|eukprot:KRX08083.1 hypothetical protein PPERSA_10445 [Pseudocohnilembus persalinus]